MALYLIVVQAHFIMNNIFEGMIWFFLPVSLVIINDIFAYICGITFGKTQLIKLSPKKTVEGEFRFRFVQLLRADLFSRLRRCMGLHNPLRLLLHQHPHAIEILHLSSQRPRRQHLHRTAMRPEPSLHPTHLYPTIHPTWLGLRATNSDHITNAIPHHHPSLIRIADRTIRRILRIRPQTHIQHQRFRRLHPGTRRHDRSHGLSIHNGILQLHVLSELHCPVQSQCGRCAGDCHHWSFARGADCFGEGFDATSL